MREILFRGKDENDVWQHGFYCAFNDESYRIYSGFAETDCGDYYPDWDEVNPETVGQYTGLTDKNGKKIFEGDIVRLVYNGNEHIYQVVYDVTELDFKATNGREEYGNNFQYPTCCEEVEVIGNIYDNPELLRSDTE